MSASTLWLLRAGFALALLGSLFLWWRWGLPVGLADAVWMCLPFG